MFIAKTLWLLRKSKTPGTADKDAFRGLYSPEEMHSILDRERARADRGGGKFSLLTFSDAVSGDTRLVLSHAARILKERARSTDELGWLDDGRMGIALPDTPVDGAWILAGDVSSSFPVGVPLPRCQVYGYPSGWLSGGEPLGEADDAMQPSANEKPAGALETLLVQPMPAWKRLIDVTGSSLGLLVLAPLFPMVAATIKLTSPGPVFFTQLRSGRGGRPFRMYKFRSMVIGAEQAREELLTLNEQDGAAFKIKADPRVTRFGRLIRATSIDELPQLWNVLRGDMSLVGPRPLPCSETAECRGWRLRRLDVTPGLTCFWQTSDRQSVSFDEWMRMDLRYSRSRSMWQDIRLIVATAFVMLKGNRY